LIAAKRGVAPAWGDPYNPAMPLLIDGHNLIGRLPDLHLSDPRDEEKLIARLKQYVARTGRRVVVVFDPPRGGDPSSWFTDDRHEYRNLTVIFAQAGRKADDVIRERVANEPDRQGLIVVTSDAAVAGFARQCGVRNIRASERFGEELRATLVASTPKEKPSASPADVDDWLKVFKEPGPAPEPKPERSRPSKPQAKRLRRMEQLKKQAANRRKLH
jgi:predicted RNA-binding protein with PIN domain